MDAGETGNPEKPIGWGTSARKSLPSTARGLGRGSLLKFFLNFILKKLMDLIFRAVEGLQKKMSTKSALTLTPCLSFPC